MRRGKPLNRGTKQMKRTALARGTTELKRTPLAPISRKRLVVNTQRRVVVSAMREAAAGRCARCHRGDGPVHGHERLARSQGGDILRPDVVLCNDCNGWCEDAPVAAAFTGWKISSKHTHDPALTSSQAVDLYGNIVEFAVAAEDVAS